MQRLSTLGCSHLFYHDSGHSESCILLEYFAEYKGMILLSLFLRFAGSAAGQPNEAQSAAPKPQAMRLEYIQHPQDESSDAAVHFVLAPSYVTYNAATIQRVQDFFKSEQVWPKHLYTAC